MINRGDMLLWVNRENKKYRTAIYCRLSDEDYEKKREVSESIENQMFICRKYIEERPELEEAEVYIDDGHTGLDYDRAGYIRMMEDVDAEKSTALLQRAWQDLDGNTQRQSGFLR